MFDSCFLWYFKRTVPHDPKKSRFRNELRLCFAFENARIDMPCNGVHDGVWCSPFALVLAIDLLPKDKGYTESSTSVGRTISISDGRARSQRGTDGERSAGRSTLSLTKLPDDRVAGHALSLQRRFDSENLSEHWRLPLPLHGSWSSG